jgi:hypothetical protein
MSAGGRALLTIEILKERIGVLRAARYSHARKPEDDHKLMHGI